MQLLAAPPRQTPCTRLLLCTIGSLFSAYAGDVSPKFEGVYAAGETAAQALVLEKCTKLWLFMDSDCDGLLTCEEAMEAAAKILGADHEQACGPWGGECTGLGAVVNVSFFHSFAAEIFLASGNVWWSTCRLAILYAILNKFDSSLAGQTDSGSLTQVSFMNLWIGLFAQIPPMENRYFRNKDTDKDGCLSESEYDALVRYRCASSWSRCRSSAPNFMEIVGASSPDGSIAFKDVADNSSCVDKVWYSYWILQSAANGMPRVNETALCRSEDTHSGEDQDARFLISVLVLSGICSCVCACLGFGRYYRHQRKDLREAREVHKLLKAKIDTWSVFDTSLKCKVSDLGPSFRQHFGLHDSDLVEVDLFQIVHPDEFATLESLLCQINSNHHANSMPVLASLRFEYGAKAGVHILKQYKQAEIQYLPVELLMVMTSEATILVGVTALATVQPLAPGATHAALQNEICARKYSTDDAGSGNTSDISQGDNVLNGSDVVVPSGQSDAPTFRSMEATSHRGGQVTRDYNSLKQRQFCPQAVSDRLMPETVDSTTGSTISQAESQTQLQ